MPRKAVTISLPVDLSAAARQRQAALGYSLFSHYIQALIRADTLRQEDHLRESVTPPSPAPHAGPVSYRRKPKARKPTT